MRKLLITRRTVPLDQLEEYGAAWARVTRAARECGCRAWLFRRTDHEDRFSEFVEWSGDSSLPDDVADAVRELDECGAAQDAGTWDETSLL